MSYRNPPIIVDKSGDIWAQTIANFGQQVAAGITKYGEARKAEIEATRKNKQAMQALSVQVNEQYSDAAREQYLALKKKGDDKVAEKFKQEMALLMDGSGTPGEEGYKMGAIDARVQLQLGRDLTDAQRKEYQGIIDNYKDYQSQMVNGFGKVVTGMNYVKDKKETSGGEPGGYIFKGKNNLERFNNQLAYYALDPDSMISTDTIETHDIERGENNENFLTTKTLIPVERMTDKDSPLSKALTPQELENVNIVEQDGKKYYEFNFKKDTNIWDGEFIDDVGELPDYSKTFEVAQIEDDKGNLTATYSANISRVEGNIKKEEEIVNLEQIKNNTSLRADMMGEAEGVLQGSPEQIEAFLQFGTNRATLTYNSFVRENPDFTSQQTFIADALVQNSIETKFSADYLTREATAADVAKLKQSDPNTIVKEGDQIGYRLLKSEEIKEEKPSEKRLTEGQIRRLEYADKVGYFDKRYDISELDFGSLADVARQEGLTVEEQFASEDDETPTQIKVAGKIIKSTDDPAEAKKILLIASGVKAKDAEALIAGQREQFYPGVTAVEETDFSEFIEK